MAGASAPMLDVGRIWFARSNANGNSRFHWRADTDCILARWAIGLRMSGGTARLIVGEGSVLKSA